MQVDVEDGGSSVGAVLTDLSPTWQAALARQLVADAEALRNPPYPNSPQPFADFYTLAWAR